MKSGGARPLHSQLVYAKTLDSLVRIGLVVIVAAFALYVADLLPGGSTVDDVTSHWHLSAHEYAESMGRAEGWARLSPPMSGETLSMITLRFLGVVSIICLIRIAPIFVGERDWAYSSFVIAEIVVLAVAASGILAQGGH